MSQNTEASGSPQSLTQLSLSVLLAHFPNLDITKLPGDLQFRIYERHVLQTKEFAERAEKVRKKYEDAVHLAVENDVIVEAAELRKALGDFKAQMKNHRDAINAHIQKIRETPGKPPELGVDFPDYQQTIIEDLKKIDKKLHELIAGALEEERVLSDTEDLSDTEAFETLQELLREWSEDDEEQGTEGQDEEEGQG